MASRRSGAAEQTGGRGVVVAPGGVAGAHAFWAAFKLQAMRVVMRAAGSLAALDCALRKGALGLMMMMN